MSVIPLIEFNSRLFFNKDKSAVHYFSTKGSLSVLSVDIKIITLLFYICLSDENTKTSK